MEVRPEIKTKILNAIKAVCHHEVLSISYRSGTLFLVTKTEEMETGEFSEMSLTRHVMDGFEGWLEFNGVEDF